MIIQLEEPFKTLYRKGYLRTESDGRKYVSLYNAPGDQRSISYARYLYSVQLGFEVPDGIEIDHRDGDKTNDDVDNLRPMTFEMHRDKTYLLESKKEVIVDLLCPGCQLPFTRTARYVRDKKSQGQTDFHCSRRCSLKQISVLDNGLQKRIKELQGENLSSYKIAAILQISRNTVMKYW